MNAKYPVFVILLIHLFHHNSCFLDILRLIFSFPKILRLLDHKNRLFWNIKWLKYYVPL